MSEAAQEFDEVEDTKDEAASGAADAATADWKEAAGVAGNPQFEKFQTPADLAKSYAELEAYRGGSIRIPSEEAGEEQLKEFTEKLLKVPGVTRIPGEDDTDGWNNIYQQLGRPTAPDGYKFTEIVGFESDSETEGAFKALAHENGLTAKQADAVHKWLGGNVAKETLAKNAAIEADVGKLKGEWGQAFDHKLGMAKNAAAQLEEHVPGISEYFDQMANNGYDASMIRLMDYVANLMGESGAIAATPSGGMMPEEAREKLNDIRNNPEHPANNEMHPHYEQARAEVVKLYKAAYSS